MTVAFYRLCDYRCLRFLDKWSPALQIRTVLLSIQALLSAPNPDDPLANDVADQWKTNEAQAIETGSIHSLPGIFCRLHPLLVFCYFAQFLVFTHSSRTLLHWN